jgi:Cu2+-exporting ATPase/Cu+-exporting ATPase
MECNGCKTEIEKELGFQKGVVEVEGDLATKNVRVVYKTKKNNAENLVACVQKAGYQAKLVKKNCGEGNASGTHNCQGNGTNKKGCCDKKEQSGTEK